MAKTEARTAKHLNASSYITDTETTLVDQGVRVVATVRMLPGLTYWSCPNAATIRKWVDQFLAEGGTPRKRDGARIEEIGGPVTMWRFVYYTTAK